MTVSISDLVRQFELKPSAPFSDRPILGVRTLAEAEPGFLSFLTNPKYAQLLSKTKASAVLVETADVSVDVLQLATPEPYAVLGRILELLYPEPERQPGVHGTAVVHDAATLGASCVIGPHCVVERGAHIGDGCILESHVVVGRNCRVGPDSHLFSHVVLYPECRIGARVRIHANCVIGGDGFGYAQTHGRHQKIPQIGHVVIEDDVEIGSNTSIDRGAIGVTRIGAGTKIDNLVQIGHGVTIGAHALIVGQVGIAGSATIGDHAILAGQVGVVGHVTIGDGVVVMGKSVVTKDLLKPGRYAGNPAIPHVQYQRQLATLRSIDKMRKRIQSLEDLMAGE